MMEKARIKLSESTKLADLVQMDYKLLNVLSRMGVSLGFGERTVSEMCEKKGIDINVFLMICRVYAYVNYIPSVDKLSKADPRSVLEYLRNSHTFYLDHDIMSLEVNIGRMLESCEDVHIKIVNRFFADCKRQLESHFAYEEHVVFPYVESLMAGERFEAYSIEQFEQNHSSIDETIGDLKNIIMKYLPETCDAVLRNDVLHQIFELEDDLYKHTLVENIILIPVVSRLEGMKL